MDLLAYFFLAILRAYFAALKWAVRSLAHILLGLPDSLLWVWDSIREKPSRLLGILAIFIPLAMLILIGPSAWFYNWPAMFGVALALYGALKSPLAAAPPFLRNLVKLGIAVCLLVGWSLLLRWEPMLQGLGVSRRETFYPWLAGLAIFCGAVAWVLFPEAIVAMAGHRSQALIPRAGGSRKLRYTDVGGMEEAKQQIRELVESRLNAGKYRKYGMVRNGILLYGPQGSGKTFLAEATAGEFRLRYHYVSTPTLVSMWQGMTESNVRDLFREATVRKPALLFLDEFDSLGTARQIAGNKGDPGGAGRSSNSTVVQLMQCIDQYRSMDGFVLMAATNLLDGLDPALIREGRFDLKIRVDLPDEAARLKILESQLANRPCERFGLQEFARRTPGASAAKLKALADRAAALAARERRKIGRRDFDRALNEMGCKDRPLVQPVQWEDLVLEGEVERDLRTLARLLDDPDGARRINLPTPTGLLLLGPPGTGKTMLARLLATRTRRSFYPLTAADILGGHVGDSVKRVSQIFARARENSPSLIFIDEMDGLLPRSTGRVGQHDIQVTEQFMIEISNLQAEQNVFLVGTTNHPERIDPRVLRGGRFSEKIAIGLPSRASRERLLRKYLDNVVLGSDAAIPVLAERLHDLSPADLEAISNAARRFAFNRAPDGSELPPLIWADFEKAVQRVRGTVLNR
ncbi:MAG TPA: AAA family ATPase [Terriglobia bacterium]|nr:AAA family ATPase [Terriglobia bacterium]